MKRWLFGLCLPILLLFGSCTVAQDLLQSLENLSLSDIENVLSGLIKDDVVLDDAEFSEDAALLQVYIIDCGQGDSIFTIFPDGKTMLVDASTQSGSDEVLDFLSAFGLSGIDYVVATHPHEDHIGGLDECINTYTVGQVFMPDITNTTASFERVLDAIEAQNLPIDVPNPGEYIIGDAKSEFSVQCLAPNREKYDDLNNYSIVLRLVYGERSILLTGDAEELSEKEMLKVGFELSADVLKLGHHGSSTSSSAKFIEQVSPTYAIASCGKDNDYGHPHSETLSKAKANGWIFYRTDTDGTVAILTDGSAISVQALGK
ncbi:MAG: MBL fold metallo-hydrolase [Clostridia bacterium]|nr:MBL fold metallo-hydrolase [Clostridia bacterium]